ncbi:maltose alpha-D-glucosyltransferase [Drechslerella dactyloides]|uniref:Maltose alpha-D-glucosyltransferase n=1 Tax=Drechslerella dactyloides TaxID=74499 RepID=A0AAD6J6M9_DREDA|nr:maltose alpha-D-glucosyltransferase [Drechslerella dactyloides]
MLIRAFYDSSVDKTSDLKSLIAKLDYLRWLGMGSLWRPPVYTTRPCGMVRSDVKTCLEL